MKNYIFVLPLLLVLSIVKTVNGKGLHFQGAHSHNDYHQPHPLTDALNNGMISIEADVFLQNGQLLVGHEKSELAANRTLESLYLNPLWKRINQTQARFSPIILMIDIKDNGGSSYEALKKILVPYRKMLTRFHHNKIEKRAVTIILSGDRPVEQMRIESDRFAFIDGRISDLSHQESPLLFPLISDDWNRYFSWKGKGTISPGEYKKLKQLVNDCHLQGKMIRFWGMPFESEQSVPFWNLFRKAGVDLIGCDCPSCYKNYLEKSHRNDN